jgi:hypothetical protein
VSLDSEKLQETIVKTVVLETNIGHLSDRVKKLCQQIDNSLPLLEKINLRMEDDLMRRAVSDKLLTKLAEDCMQISFLQKTHEKKITDHDADIASLKRIADAQKTVISTGKLGWKILTSMVVGCFTIWTAINGYLENIRGEREHAALIIMQESEEKKKKMEYNRVKYLIRNGKYNGEPKD